MVFVLKIHHVSKSFKKHLKKLISQPNKQTKTEIWAPSPEVLIHFVWGRIYELKLFSSSSGDSNV